MKALTLAAAVLICAFAPAAHAETARELKSRCTGMTGKANINLCFGQIGGILNSLRDNPAYCIPRNVNNQVLVPIVRTYLAEHPDDWRLDAGEAVGKAVLTAYPCPVRA